MKTAYSLWGRLPSGCVHGTTLTRKQAAALINQHGERVVRFSRSGVDRVVQLKTRTSSLLEPQRRYVSIEIGVVRT